MEPDKNKRYYVPSSPWEQIPNELPFYRPTDEDRKAYFSALFEELIPKIDPKYNGKKPFVSGTSGELPPTKFKRKK